MLGTETTLAPPNASRTLEALVLEHAPAALVVLDSHDRVTCWNRAAAALYGWSAAEAIGRDAAELGLRQESSPPQGLLDAVGGGQSWCGDLPGRCKDGSTLVVQATVAPIHGRDGHYAGSIYVVFAPARGGARDESAGRAIGRRIARARVEAGLTQKELSADLEITTRSLQGYESGAVVPYRHFERLGEVLRRDAGWFLGEGDAADEVLAEHRRSVAQDVRRIVREEVAAALQTATKTSPPEP